VEKVIVEQVHLRVPRYSLDSVIQPMFHTVPLIYATAVSKTFTKLSQYRTLGMCKRDKFGLQEGLAAAS
jgi:hypothetical protein